MTNIGNYTKSMKSITFFIGDYIFYPYKTNANFAVNFKKEFKRIIVF